MMKHADSSFCRRARAGFTLVELMIGTVILFLLAIGLVESIASLRRLTEDGSVDGQLQNMAEKAMKTIVTDLKRSGFEGEYPYLFEDGNAAVDPDFAEHAHAPAAHAAQPGDSDFGPSQEIAFRLPADADMDDVPDTDGNGQLVWDGRDFSFVLVTRADGINYLERRSDAGVPQIVAHHVERVFFEVNGNDDVTLPIGAIRVRLWFRKFDNEGALHRFFTETLLNPRNG